MRAKCPLQPPPIVPFRRPSCWLKPFCIVVLACLTNEPPLQAQLAVTEVMSWASTDCAGCEAAGPAGCHPDFWELTNFGTNAIDLTGYRFSDGDPRPFELAPPLPATTIAAGESIVFVRTWPDFPDTAAFRQWWGDSNLPPGLQVGFYPRYIGFDFLGDGVRLWDANANIVDEVSFGGSRQGITFDYDRNSGKPVPSEWGFGGAFRAAACGDIGSPGWAPGGPVPLRITRQPVSQIVDVGGEVTFAVEASGLPRPRSVQWYFQGLATTSAPAGPETIPTVVAYAGCGPAWTASAKPTDLTIFNAQPRQAGEYFAVFTNGLERLTSAVVTLSVNTNPMPPRILCPREDLRWPVLDGVPENSLVATPSQAIRFEVVARGYPLPTFRWSWSADGTSFARLPNATNRTLAIPAVSASDAGIYRVEVQNLLGTNEANTRLIVKEKPRLKITEAMASSCSVAEDWWELTNVGNESINLFGYRWDGYPGVLGGGPTVISNLVVHAGESVIFLEGHASDFFMTWWGHNNLPLGLKIIPYSANGLSAEDDEISLWNPTAFNDGDWVDQVAFSTSTPGKSFWFAPNDPCSEFGIVSAEGQCGTVHAANGCDLGSPGWTAWTPPQLTSLRREGSRVRLEWKAEPGSSNVVQYTSNLASSPGGSVWTDLGPPLRFATAIGTTEDSTIGNNAQRFYRIRKVASAVCDCSE